MRQGLMEWPNTHIYHISNQNGLETSKKFGCVQRLGPTRKSLTKKFEEIDTLDEEIKYKENASKIIRSLPVSFCDLEMVSTITSCFFE